MTFPGLHSLGIWNVNESLTPEIQALPSPAVIRRSSWGEKYTLTWRGGGTRCPIKAGSHRPSYLVLVTVPAHF